MKKILLAIIIILLFGFYKKEDLLTINIHHTYFLISYLHISIATILILSLFLIIMAFLKKKKPIILKIRL